MRSGFSSSGNKLLDVNELLELLEFLACIKPSRKRFVMQTGSLLKWLNILISVSSSRASRFFSVSSTQTNGSYHFGCVIVTQHFCLDFRM